MGSVASRTLELWSFFLVGKTNSWYPSPHENVFPAKKTSEFLDTLVLVRCTKKSPGSSSGGGGGGYNHSGMVEWNGGME